MPTKYTLSDISYSLDSLEEGTLRIKAWLSKVQRKRAALLEREARYNFDCIIFPVEFISSFEINSCMIKLRHLILQKSRVQLRYHKPSKFLQIQAGGSHFHVNIL